MHSTVFTVQKMHYVFIFFKHLMLFTVKKTHSTVRFLLCCAVLYCAMLCGKKWEMSNPGPGTKLITKLKNIKATCSIAQGEMFHS